MSARSFVPRTLVTSLPPAECARRLRAEVGSPFGLTLGDARPLRGTVSERGFDIHAHTGLRRAHYHLRGRFSPDAAGTRLRVSWGMGHFDRWVIVPLVALVTGAAFAHAVLHRHVWGLSARAMSFSWLMLVLAPLSLLALARARGREHDALLHDVERILEASALHAPEPQEVGRWRANAS